MNLILTDVCNRACPYCFAQSKVSLADREVAGVAAPISLDNYELVLDFLEKSSVPELKLLGGEPTTHPEITRIVERGLARGLVITIFSNGLWSSRVQQLFRQPNTDGVRFLINVNEPARQSGQENARQHRALEIAGERASLGFNIYRSDFDLRFVADLIDRHGLRREVRLGLAHPIVGEINEAPGDAELPVIGARLIAQLRELESRDVLGSFDCGFPLCMFPAAELDALVTCSTGFSAHCGIIIDIGPDLTVWPCFPLSNVHNVRLQDFATLAELRDYYSRQLSGVRAMGSLPECLDCRYLKRNQCAGGCMARTLRSWSGTGDPQILEKLNRTTVAR